MWSIARGTTPLALFGSDRYPVVMGWLAAPNLVVQAAAPFAAGLVIGSAGAALALSALAAFAFANVGLTLALLRSMKRN